VILSSLSGSLSLRNTSTVMLELAAKYSTIDSISNHVSGVTFAFLGAGAIDRWTLTGAKADRSPPAIVVNLTISAAAQLATGLRVKNVTLNGDVVLQHTYPYFGDTWHMVTVAPPSRYGWVSAPLMQTTAVSLDVHMTCGALDALQVRIVVPAPAVVQNLAAEVKAAVSSSLLVTVAAGGATSGAALGRVMVTRSLMLCNADAAIGGGVLDLGIAPCAAEDNGNNTARSAVLGNIVLVCIIGLVILLGSSLLAAVGSDQPFRAALSDSTTVMLIPSSLLPAFVVALPSTAASAALLAARLESSTCRVFDVVLVVIAIIYVGAPVVAVVVLHNYASRSGWVCTRQEAPPQRSSTWCDTFVPARILHHATCRRYKWQLSLSNKLDLKVTTPTAWMQRMWVVLLEYRVLWYAAFDCCGLVAVGAFAVAGGLAPSSCSTLMGVVIALQCLQLLVLLVVRPYTTLLEWIYSAATLTLTIVSVVGQLLFALMTSTPGEGQAYEWALTLSVICDLAIVGVALSKSLVDAYSFAMGVRRRVVHAKATLLKRRAVLQAATSGIVPASDAQQIHIDAEVDVATLDGLPMNFEDLPCMEHHDLLSDAVVRRMIAEIESQFWDANGVARL
jgi:hypothetical protein